MSKTVDQFVAKKSEWKTALERLRSILLQTELEESIKWGSPVYSFGTKNVVGLGAFKSYVGLWFFQGVFLKDDAGVLENAQEGKTKALRQWRFSSAEEIEEELVKAYVDEAIANQKAGKELKPQKKKLEVPMELTAMFRQDEGLKAAFKELSPGKQKEYAEHIDSAKQEKTRLSRLEKAIPMIKDGVGLNDRYKNC